MTKSTDCPRLTPPPSLSPMKPAQARTCPCGLGQPYDTCCGPWHRGAPAPDAETLMRSRYCAYVLGDANYLLATWYPSTRPANLELANEPRPRWLGLDVKGHAAIDPDHATVDFVARYKINGRAFRMHEISRFLREDGRWYYLDGDIDE
jgi:SEC-C motif domain protein